MDEWVRWALGIGVPLLVMHAAWATLTLIRLKQMIDGNGQTGIGKKVEALSTRVHDLATKQQVYQGKFDLLTERLERKPRTRE